MKKIVIGLVFLIGISCIPQSWKFNQIPVTVEKNFIVLDFHPTEITKGSLFFYIALYHVDENAEFSETSLIVGSNPEAYDGYYVPEDSPYSHYFSVEGSKLKIKINEHVLDGIGYSYFYRANIYDGRFSISRGKNGIEIELKPRI